MDRINGWREYFSSMLLSWLVTQSYIDTAHLYFEYFTMWLPPLFPGNISPGMLLTDWNMKIGKNKWKLRSSAIHFAIDLSSSFLLLLVGGRSLSPCAKLTASTLVFCQIDIPKHHLHHSVTAKVQGELSPLMSCLLPSSSIQSPFLLQPISSFFTKMRTVVH